MAHHMALDSEYRGKLSFTVEQGQILPSHSSDRTASMELQDKIIAADAYVYVKLRDGAEAASDVEERAIDCLMKGTGLGREVAQRFFSDALDYSGNPDNSRFPKGKEISVNVLIRPHTLEEEPTAVCEEFTEKPFSGRRDAGR